MMTRWMTAAAATVAIVTSAHAQVDEAAKNLLNKATDALHNAHTLEFKAKRYATGMLKGYVDYEGEVKMIRENAARGLNRDAVPMRISGVSRTSGSADQVFDVYLDGEGHAVWIDKEKKQVIDAPIAPRTDAAAAASSARQLLIDNIFAAQPFEKEFAAEKIEYRGTQEFRGEPVEVIRVIRGNSTTFTEWAFGADDKLPRKIEMNDSGANVAMIVEMWDVKANAPFTKEALGIPTPEGFTRDVRRPVAQTVQSAQPEPVAPPQLGIAEGNRAPAFELQSGDGSAVSLDSLNGNVVVLAFWGTWNGSSVRALPVLEEMNKAYADKNVKILGAAVQRDRASEEATKLFAEKGFSFPVLLGAGDVAREYQVKGFPSFAVIGPAGNMVEFIQGMPGEENLKNRLTAAIDKAMGKN